MRAVPPVGVAAAVRPQIVTPAARADPRDLDRFDAQILELRDVGGPQVEHDRAVGALPYVGTLTACLNEVGARSVDRVAAGADRGADRRDDGRGAGPRADERAHEALR